MDDSHYDTPLLPEPNADHRCGRCANPYSRSGDRSDCPNAKET